MPAKKSKKKKTVKDVVKEPKPVENADEAPNEYKYVE
eukprot:CAMPEP_0176355734 /NCGR_PEP_ID=MMETSP0126-20121128/13505_1 /TAXON_ID=141414 ORGANISM="Strombidinopsis acuminatum, Strain SPMC142" /NCGR_SAMPLE_ID=MMETSP0126 /ASSEMBLY_ACC=CAM_ASM_000229 /LENGTH=36 /DNA_ID= /DNA_START= /DNA_END= /DNA_ORIENTATION=